MMLFRRVKRDRVYGYGAGGAIVGPLGVSCVGSWSGYDIERHGRLRFQSWRHPRGLTVRYGPWLAHVNIRWLGKDS